MLVLFLEMTVYLAYYKDVIFGTFTSINFIGMYLYQQNPDIVNGSSGNYSPKQEQINTAIIAFISLSFVFLITTLVLDYQQAFYLKYRMYFTKFKDMKKQTKK